MSTRTTDIAIQLTYVLAGTIVNIVFGKCTYVLRKYRAHIYFADLLPLDFLELDGFSFEALLRSGWTSANKEYIIYFRQ